MSSVRFFFPSREDVTLTGVLYALSDPTRLRVVVLLNETGDQCCGNGAFALIPKSTLAHHFKVLRENGIIMTRTEGTYSVNSLRRADLDARFPGLLDSVLNAIRADSQTDKGKAPTE